jgi:membrane protein YdbS with pleckstrin-like domain
MIPLNARQGLPPNALVYTALRSFAVALLLVLVGTLARVSAHSGNVTCHGLLCGKQSGDLIPWLLYLYAVYLLLRSVLNYKWLSFLLTDKSISIESGVFARNSCTFRYDRIQDIDTYRDPLHLMLGLKSVAIWTSSPDQFAGRRRKPDGLLVLEADDADWLKSYLSDPQTAAGGAAPAAAGNNPQLPSSPAGRHRPGTALALILGVAAVSVLALLMLWNEAPVSGGAAAPAASAPATPPAPAPNAKRHTHVHALQQPGADLQATAGNYGVACAIGDSGANGLKPCADLGQAQRCSHEADFPSQPTAEQARLTVVNRSRENVNFYWLNFTGARTLYAALPPGGQVSQASHIGAHWMLSTRDGRCIGIFDAATMTIGIF